MPRSKGEEYNYVTLVEIRETGHQDRVKCIFCEMEFTANATRIRAHILGNNAALGVSKCSGDIPSNVKQKLLKKEEDMVEKNAKRQKMQKLSKAATPEASTSASQQNIKTMFSKKTKSEVDECLARAFYATGVPFYVLENPFFKEAITAIANFGPAYKLPTRQSLSTNLLDSCYEKFRKDEEESHLSQAKLSGGTLCSDGYTNIKRKPLLNSVLVTTRGPYFLDCVSASGETKSGQFIAEWLIPQIEKVGPENVTVLITDNAANCKAAWTIIEEKFPHIFCMGCSAHVLDLFLEDIGKIMVVKEAISNASTIINFVRNREKVLSMFSSKSKLELLKPAETRFATNFTMLKRLIEVRGPLEETFADRSIRDFCENQPPKFREQFATAKSIIFYDKFWKIISAVCDMCAPVVSLLRLVDSDTPVMGKIYYKMFQLGERIQNFVSEDLPDGFVSDVKSKFDSRWGMMHSPLHSAGFALDPEYQDFGQLSNPEVIGELHTVFEKIYQDDIAAQASCVSQYMKFKQKEGLFGNPVAIQAAKKMPAHEWWTMYGCAVPELSKVATRILAQISSATSCERIWSNYEFIHNRRRNKLLPDKATKLVFLFQNLRITKKIRDVDYESKVVPWEFEPVSENED